MYRCQGCVVCCQALHPVLNTPRPGGAPRHGAGTAPAMSAHAFTTGHLGYYRVTSFADLAHFSQIHFQVSRPQPKAGQKTWGANLAAQAKHERRPEGRGRRLHWSTAFWCRRQETEHVALFDKLTSCGASGRNAGQVPVRTWQLCGRRTAAAGNAWSALAAAEQAGRTAAAAAWQALPGAAPRGAALLRKQQRCQPAGACGRVAERRRAWRLWRRAALARAGAACVKGGAAAGAGRGGPVPATRSQGEVRGSRHPRGSATPAFAPCCNWPARRRPCTGAACCQQRLPQ